MICNAKHWRRPNALLKRTPGTYSKKTSQAPSLEGNLCYLQYNFFFKHKKRFIFYQMHSFLKIILLCAQSIPTVLSIKIPSWITNPQVQGPVKNAKLRSYKIPKLFEIINWSFLLNGIVCDCVLFFRVLHHRETVLYHLVQLKPSKSNELRVSYPSTVLYFEFCFMWG